jgi:hypothetical protein
MTSNQLYGGMNKRFEKRAKHLRQLGFAYKIVAEGVAGFVRTRYGKTRTITASAALYATNRTWINELQSALA